MSQQPTAPQEPQQIARRYQIVQKLGAGAFGTVYKAKDGILGRMVAIKTIRLEGLAAVGVSLEELVDRFQQEARVSAQLRHPNIVTIYDVGESEGMSYLAMEFIDGTGLDKVIAAEKRLPIERAASIGAQVADALGFAHQHNVVHRDIKPANIMIEAGDRVKVTDFGIAKVTDSAQQLTVTGTLLGTPSYMSPEQARGQALDGRSDLFAVGSVLYEMVTGTKAFRGDSITGLIFKIITEQPAPIRELDPTVPEAMIRIIRKALEKAPEARYQTGREMAAELLALAGAASRPTVRLAEVPTSPGLKVKPLPAVPTLSSAPTVSGPAPTTAQPKAAAATQPPPPVSRPATLPRAVEAPRRAPVGLLVGLAFGLLALLAIAAGALYHLTRRPPPGGEAASLGTEVAVGEPATASLPPAGPAREIPAAGVEQAPHAYSQPAPLSRPPTAGAEPRVPAAASSPQETGQPAPPRSANQEYAFLDQEPQDQTIDGGEAGRRLAEAYRSNQGSAGSYGGGATARRRPRSPMDLTLAEMPAVATLRHLINAEQAHYRRHERYGSFQELAEARLLRLDVPVAVSRFARRNYRFELEVEADGFRVAAVPLAPGRRGFVGDDTGFIQAGIE